VSSAPGSAVWSFDLAPVARRYERNGGQDAARVEQEFRRFAALCAEHPEGGLAPSLPVDGLWHELVLDSTRYREFCQQAYGAFLDHIPDDSGQGMEAEFAATKALYETAYGAPDPILWGMPGNSMSGRRRPSGA
jgi:hypothetical protein